MRKNFFTHSFICCIAVCFALTSFAQDKTGKINMDNASSPMNQINGARTSMVDTWTPREYYSDAANAIFIDDMNGDNTITGLTARGWVVLNEDGGGITDPWYQGASTASGGPFDSYEGPDTGYVASNYNGANPSGVIDQWLISPEVTVQAGDVVKFWHRAPDGNPYDDSIFVHYSTTAGITAADFDQTWGRYLVSETGWAQWVGTFNHTGTVRFAVQYYIFDGGPVGTYSNYMGLDLFEVETPCPIDPPTNPDPSDGAMDVNINYAALGWTNGAGANNVEVWFDGAMIYDGPAVSTFPIPGPLAYSTTYPWLIVGKNDTCNVPGPTWSFTTITDPSIVCVFMDDFNGTTNWSAVNLNDPCDWGYSITSAIPGSGWGDPNFPATADNFYAFASSDACGTAMNVYFTGNFSVDASMYQTVWIEFDSDFEVYQAPTPADTAAVDVSVDGGTTWTRVFLRVVDAPAEHAMVDITGIAGLQGDIRFRLCYYGDYSWHWALDNFKVCFTDFIPVELTSFTATINEGNVRLNWSTATETNNMGFEVQRANGSEYSVIGFVQGNGTTSEVKNYIFTDKHLEAGSYTYRLRQIDYDGTSEFSNVVEVEVIAPAVYSLDQNYPNPFNPNTMISFTLASDSKVILTIFDVLGQEVTKLINGNLAAGRHEYDFNASNLNSGVYFYRIDATGVDGTNFSAVKKMILTK